VTKLGGGLSVAELEDNIPNTTHSHIITIPKSITTLLDLGASDHCFVERKVFSSYQPISPPRTGNSARKGSTFTIEGTGTAELLTGCQDALSKILLTGSLHTPNIRCNLILVSKLVSKGAKIYFEGDTAVVHEAGGAKIFTATKRDGLYVLDIAHGTNVHSIRTGKKTVPYGIWHCCLGHILVDTIAKMSNNNLINGLKTTGEAKLRAICEDCLYGKHTTHPFNNPVQRETCALECIYIDIWGPAPTQSAGGAKYFMLCMDGATSYQKVYFLSSKMAEVTLQTFKEFHVEAERQTGLKLRRVCSDMGRKWCNAL
jgi:hypothetical protein